MSRQYRSEHRSGTNTQTYRADRNANGRSGDSSEAAESKRKLEELFGGNKGGSTPSPSAAARVPQERVFASPRKSLGRAPSEYRLRLERLRIARSVEEITEAANAFLAQHQLPDDLDILYKLLKHPAEKVQREAMGQLSALLMQGRVPSMLLLEEHLRDVEGRAQEDGTKSYVAGLRSQIASRQG